MKKYININQDNFIKIGKIKDIKVDSIDGILFDWIQNFTKSGKALKKLIDNKLYIWVSYKAIREDNPLCHINTNDVVGRRLNKLVELGLLEKFKSEKDGNKVFFTITEYAFMYLLESHDLPTQKSEALPTQKSDNSKLIDSKLDSNKKTIKKEDKSLKLLNNHQFKNNILEFITHRRGIKKPMSDLAIKKFVNKVDKFIGLNYNIVDIIDNSITAGYSDIYEPKNKQTTKQQSTHQQNPNTNTLDQVLETYIFERKKGTNKDYTLAKCKEMLHWNFHKEFEKLSVEFEQKMMEQYRYEWINGNVKFPEVNNEQENILRLES